MSAGKVSVDEAKSDKLFYVVANAVIYRRTDGRCLILKRDPREKVHPSKWATIGGKLEHSDLDLKNPSRIDGEVIEFDDSISELLAREALEESGVDIKPLLKFLGTKVIVRADGIPVVLLKFTAEYESGQVKPEPGAFTEFAWVSAQEVDKYDCIESVPEEVKAAINLFNNRS